MNGRPATIRDVSEHVGDLEKKVATKWEMRFWIVGALIANQFLPLQDAAYAAVGIF